jgi:hypothetical protein
MLGSRGWTIPLRAYRYIYQQATCDGGQWYAHKGSKPMRRGVLRRRQSLEDIRTAVDGNGGRDPLYLLESGTRLLHLLPRDGLTRVYSLAKFDAKDLVFGASPNALFEAVAPEAPRGYFPRGFSGERAYWTIAGIDGGVEEGLLSEDGAVEAGKAGFSVEPFVVMGSEPITCADAQARHALPQRIPADPHCRLAAQGAGVSGHGFRHRLGRGLAAHCALRGQESRRAPARGHAGDSRAAVPAQSAQAVLEHAGQGESLPQTHLVG